MAREPALQRSFNAGELSPDVGAQIDLDFFRNGCRVLENFLPLVQGPAERRGGTRFIEEIKSSSSRAALIAFEFSTVQTYQFELGGNYLRVYRDKFRITVADTDAAITNGDFPTDLTGWTDLSTAAASIAHDATDQRMNLVGAAASIAIAEQSVTTTKTGQAHVIRVSVFGFAGESVNLRIGTSSGGEEILADTVLEAGFHAVDFTPSASPFFVQLRNPANKTIGVDDISIIDNAPVEIATPWAQGDLFDAKNRLRVKFTQSFDIQYLVHPDKTQYKLARRSHTAWSLTKIFFTDGPYLPQNVDAAKTLAPSATTGNITITAAGHAPFAATDVGRLVRVLHSSTWGYARITGFTSTTVVNAEVLSDFAGITAQSAWRLGAWSDTTGYPSAVGFHQQRLVFGGARFQPNRLDASVSGDFENFTPGSNPADPLSRTLDSEQVNAIHWFASQRDLLVGTQGGEWRVFSDTSGKAIEPANVNARPATEHESTDILPVKGPTAILFLQRHAREVRELAFSFTDDDFRAPDMTPRANHITRGGIIDMAYKKTPQSVLWCARADGTGLSFTWERDQQVTAWGRQLIGRPLAGDAEIEAVSVISGAGFDEPWMIVKRTINGTMKRYVEVLEEPLALDAPLEDAFYVDSGLTLDNIINATLTPGAATGAGVTFTAGSSVFAAGDVDRDIRYRFVEKVEEDRPVYKTAVATIKSFVSGTQVTADITADFPSTAAIAANAWRMTVTQVSGADHLEGETVQVLGDGAVQPDKTVTGGSVALSRKAATVHLGLGFRSILSPMRLEAGARAGTALGMLKRIHRLTVLLERSLGFKHGRSLDNLNQAPFRNTADKMNQPPPLFSGEFEVDFDGDYDLDARLYIVQDQPLPLKVVALIPGIDAEEQ